MSARSPVGRRYGLVPTGVDIVLELHDVDAEYRRVSDAGWLTAERIRRRPRGLTDFGLHDPDWHYLRVISC